jgi:hypothetical protein
LAQEVEIGAFIPQYVFKFIIYPVSFGGQEVINKDPTVWLDGARPANTYFPLFFPVNVSLSRTNLPQKYVLKDIRIKITELYINKICDSLYKLIINGKIAKNHFVQGIVHLLVTVSIRGIISCFVCLHLSLFV